MTDEASRHRTQPTILLAAGRGDDDPAALWTALLEVAPAAVDREQAHGPASARAGSSARLGGGGPVVWAVTGIDGSVERMRAVLREGHDRLLVVPIGVLDTPDGSLDPAASGDPPPWQAPLGEAIDRLRAAYPQATIYDMGRSARGLEAAAIAELVAIPRNGSASMLAGAITRAFDGDPAEVARFAARLQTGLPAGTTIALRGSAVVGHRHDQEIPFDGDGPGTSDLDVVIVGETAVDLWVPEARLLGGINTLPLSDHASWVAPALDPVRRQAQGVIRRPLSIQAMAGWFLDLRAVVQRQPYVVLHSPS